MTVAGPAAAEWRALGTSVIVVTVDPDALAQARTAVQAELDAIDLAASRFRDDSELSRINAAHGRPVRVSPLFEQALEAALHAAQITGGAVDPTVGQALIAAGYDRDFELLTPPPRQTPGTSQPKPPARVRFAQTAGISAVRHDREHATVSVARGVKLDLGASAKALAADRSAAAAHAATGCGVLVSLGGDLATAGPAPEHGWSVRVCEDHAAGREPSQTVSITDGALATSSTTTRRWQDASGTHHHIIDPATGVPADVVWRTASVAAATCVDANAAATAAIVKGHAARDWLHDSRLPARLVARDGTIVTVGGWPAEHRA